MSWSEVKHALNSTLGTDGFKSLDELLMGNWTMITGDETMKILSNTTTELSSSHPFTTTCTPNLSGTFRLAADVERDIANEFSVTLEVTQGPTTIALATVVVPDGECTATVDVPCTKGKELTITVGSNVIDYEIPRLTCLRVNGSTTGGIVFNEEVAQ